MNNDTFETVEIIKNAIVSYIDGEVKLFDAISITDKGVIIGRIKNGKFSNCGFINKQNINKVYNGKKRRLPRTM